MLQNARWLFFDMGSTLIDESACWRCRAEETVRGSDVGAERFLSAMGVHARAGRDPYRYALREFGLSETPWPITCEKPYPEAGEVLSVLRRKYRIGIISNQAPGLTERLHQFGLADLIDSVSSSSEQGVEKPDKRLFLRALEQVGCTPEDAVMIGDRLDNDLAPARALGMSLVWIRQGFGGLGIPNPTNTPDAVAHNLSGLLQIF